MKFRTKWCSTALCTVLLAILFELLLVCHAKSSRLRGGGDVPFAATNCSISTSMKNMIHSYESVVEQIVTEITRKLFKGKAYKELAKFVDKFGDRMTGSESLERSIDYLRDQMQAIAGYRNVHTENVTVPKFLRGPEWAKLIEPWEQTIEVNADAYSVSTVPTVITAELVVCYTDKEIVKRPKKFFDKIVARFGACSLDKLASVGAKAVLLGSSLLLYAIPRRKVRYSANSSIPRIPVASVTLEDMTLFDRASKLGKKLVLQLSLTESETVKVTSRNLIGDYLGSTLSGKFVGVTAHMDSWDVGQGAQDDGFGVIYGILMVKLFNDLGLRPRRTIRSMFWTGEELGLIGSKAYAMTHQEELKRYQAVFEADVGVEINLLLYHGSEEFGCIINEIVKLVQTQIPNANLSYRKDWRSDLNNFVRHQVPTVGLEGGPHYRWFTHNNADTMTHISSRQLDRSFALYAAVAYVVADIKADFPHVPAPAPHTATKH